jgi:hypothetical protein
MRKRAAAMNKKRLNRQQPVGQFLQKQPKMIAAKKIAAKRKRIAVTTSLSQRRQHQRLQ